MSHIPHDYNAVTLSVDPNSLNAACDQVNSAGQNISDALADIMNSLSDLRLSWTGDAADVADDFNTRWTAVTEQLYGTQAEPSKGVLNVLTAGIGKAAQNYANCEGAIKTMFLNFHTGIVQAGNGSASSGSPTDTVDQPSGAPDQNYHTTAVNETGF
ncbi:WXG100 family type VII secretion target [Streptomyces hyaluromycini]|uniref:WXG100 family type VII secretion target n=1 Tax=Streptomyces hyaluromycini TaxID=1377993 RepID=A0ABV1XBN5_9ACTN